MGKKKEGEERVVVVDGEKISLREVFAYAFLSVKAHKDEVFVAEGVSRLAKEMGVSSLRTPYSGQEEVRSSWAFPP